LMTLGAARSRRMGFSLFAKHIVGGTPKAGPSTVSPRHLYFAIL
jgi:hypothetical protein